MALSPRLQAVLDALPLRPGMRVLEVGCGPGVLAQAMAQKVGPTGFVLATDRSATAIRQARAKGLAVRRVAAEALQLEPGEERYHLAVAVRVGALDGRHPELEASALRGIRAMLVPRGELWVDGVRRQDC